MSRAEAEDIERRIRLLELVSNGALPISALGPLIALATGPAGLVGFAVAGVLGLSFVRQYAKSQKTKLVAELSRLRRGGDLSDTEYQDLSATLNKLTVGSSSEK